MSCDSRKGRIFAARQVILKSKMAFISATKVAQVAKLVDAPSSGGGAARCAGSNPVLGT